MKKVHPWQKTPEIRTIGIGKQTPEWSMVMPIFNQEGKLSIVLEKIHQNASLPFSMIIIDDGSVDNSLIEINEFSEKIKNSKKLFELIIIHNPTPIFETACDNLGFSNSKTEFIIEIQSDLHIEEYAFDLKMIQAMEKLDLAAVSGRHIHSFSLIDKNNWLKYPLKLINWRILKIGAPEKRGKIGSEIFSKNSESEQICYTGETVARGPWLLRKSDLLTNEYLDEDKFFLGNDDHDFHRRVYQRTNRIVGFVPIHLYSVREDGSTRKLRSGINHRIFEYLKQNKTGSDGLKFFIKNYKPYANITKHKL